MSALLSQTPHLQGSKHFQCVFRAKFQDGGWQTSSDKLVYHRLLATSKFAPGWRHTVITRAGLTYLLYSYLVKYIYTCKIVLHATNVNILIMQSVEALRCFCLLHASL